MLKIEDFYALLTSDGEDSPLLAALRELRAIERAEDVVVAILDGEGTWAVD